MACRVLVTGVSGFVGGALGAHLRSCGYHVTGISRRPPRENAADAFLPADLSAPGPLPSFDAEVVVHAAALSSPWASPAAYRANNVDATGRLLDAARSAGVSKFVYISSSSVHYEHGDQWDLTEDTPLPNRPINLYAATKREAEALVAASGLPHAILRPRAVFGPGDTVLFPRILRAASRGVLPRIRRPDGSSPQGDLIYIDNLSHYIERAIALPVSGVYNLTNNQPVEIYAFFHRVLNRLGLRPRERAIPVSVAFLLAGLFEFGSRWLTGYREPPITRFGVEVMAYSKTFRVARALADLGPPPISLDEGLDRFIAWQR